jgi:hypothetical protein
MRERLRESAQHERATVTGGCRKRGGDYSALACHVVSKSELTTTALGSVDLATAYGSVKMTSSCAPMGHMGYSASHGEHSDMRKRFPHLLVKHVQVRARERRAG